jgi:hypothetical protein
MKARTQTGWWRDFAGTLGATPDWGAAFGWSDEWLTAFVGAGLAAVPDQRARLAACHAWSLLNHRRQPSEGWGYSPPAPVDADSTTWGLRLAAAVGAKAAERARQARRVLERHFLPDGGVTTYREQTCSRFTVQSLTPDHGSFAGWCRTAHPCVTAAVAGLPDERALHFLRRVQRADGSWTAYWWGDDEYTTGLAAEALARTGLPADQERVRRAIRWSSERIGPSGAVYSRALGAESAFATAWCVRILALADDLPAVQGVLERGVASLLGRQRADGAWPSSAYLLAPRPDVFDPRQDGQPFLACLDDASVFTTATVLSALQASCAD